MPSDGTKGPLSKGPKHKSGARKIPMGKKLITPKKGK